MRYLLLSRAVMWTSERPAKAHRRIVEYAKRLADIGEVPTTLILIDTVSRALAGGDEN